MTNKSNLFLIYVIPGTLYLLLQIVIVDILSLCQMKFELFYVAYRQWIDQPEICPYYLGLETFTSTALIFFIIALNFHTISTCNLAQKTVEKNATRLLNTSHYDCQQRCFEDEIYDDDTLINRSDTSNQQRSLTIDYSKPKNRIPVVFPIIFIWFLAASLATPLFLYGNILPSTENPKLCGLVHLNRNNSILLQFLLIKMRIIVPSVFLLISTIYVIVKIISSKKLANNIELCIFDENIRDILKLALAISIVYFLFSMQRIYGSLLFELIDRPLMEYKYPHFGKLLGLILSMIHYAAPIIRPVVYLCFDKKLWNDFKFCCRRRKHTKY